MARRLATRGMAALAWAASLLLPHSGAGRAEAMPVWRSARPIGSLTVYADDRRADLFYYAPPEMAVATRSDSIPDFQFLNMRYTGSAVSRDRGMTLHKSLVTFRVRLPRVKPDELAAAARTLGSGGRRAELRPFPIRRLSAALLYATVGADAEAAPATPLPEGRFETASEGSEAGNGSFWTERIYTIGLDSLTAQAFGAALDRGQVLLSLGYAFLGEAAGEPGDGGELKGAPELVAELRKNMASGGGVPDSARADSVGLHAVRAGAVGIAIDATRWPALLRRVDLNDRAPPGYAALDVYCYDFNNQLRADLAEKRVEIDAEGVGGRRVMLEALFRSEEPDLYSSSLRFPVAVRLDRPYRFRTHEVKRDGSSRVGPWREVAQWSQILDVTTPVKSDGVRSILGPQR